MASEKVFGIPKQSRALRLFDFLLYSHLWIAFAALALFWESQLLLSGQFSNAPLAAFVFIATLTLYNIHKIIGIRQTKNWVHQPRFRIAAFWRNYLQIIAAVGSISSSVLFYFLPPKVQLYIIVPTLIALAYAIPFLPGKRRLRDVHYIKIFLLVFVWLWVTVWLPVVDQHVIPGISVWLMSMGRFCFLFALAIPFDIRDLQLDQANQVKTLPFFMGLWSAQRLSFYLLILMLGCTWWNYELHAYTLGDALALSISAILSGLAIRFATPEKSDYYFSGVLDGMMILQFVLIWLF